MSTCAPTRQGNGVANSCAMLETIVRVADAGGGKVIVVDVDNPGLVGFYTRNGFKATGIDGDLSLYLKVSTARKAFVE